MKHKHCLYLLCLRFHWRHQPLRLYRLPLHLRPLPISIVCTKCVWRNNQIFNAIHRLIGCSTWNRSFYSLHCSHFGRSNQWPRPRPRRGRDSPAPASSSSCSLDPQRRQKRKELHVQNGAEIIKFTDNYVKRVKVTAFVKKNSELIM